MSEGIPKSIEKGPERVLAKSEVMEGMEMFVQNAQITRELSDERGLYLLEVMTEGEKSGETIEYAYQRKGESPDHPKVADTAIHVTWYSDGMPISGTKVAIFENGKWREIV